MRAAGLAIWTDAPWLAGGTQSQVNGRNCPTFLARNGLPISTDAVTTSHLASVRRSRTSSSFSRSGNVGIARFGSGATVCLDGGHTVEGSNYQKLMSRNFLNCGASWRNKMRVSGSASTASISLSNPDSSLTG